MNFFRDKTAAFTGYRPEKIRLSNSRPDIEQQIRAGVGLFVRELYGRGFRYFLSGMAEGFDLWAADEVVKLRDGELPGIELVVVVPFRGQAGAYPAAAAELYHRVSEAACRKIVLSEHYFPECFHRRNDWLVEHASAVVCYFDGQGGGTQYTVSRARRAGLPVYNLCDPALVF